MGALIDKAKGKVQQVSAAITGDRAKQAQGVVNEEKGKAKETFENVKHEVKKEIAPKHQQKP
jgi:uncharacterized protein YjbJ (UPF0337 family)